ncbi:sigma 54-interacting transcriptional regulator [Dehalobacter sp. DCM]|uniref:sigma-54 interaction domain-containing protein n=1 Tax=Dehalobacter sp. DCM TaxID=2907827 RepID=UPI0030814277|nr:sigma 54-interacting transcriptional regulator [Dehalobacter sp. DCM]
MVNFDDRPIIDYETTPENLNQIVLAKKRFIENDEDPRNNAYIAPEVAESWIRSRAYGIDPHHEKEHKTPEPKEIRALLQANKLLLQTAIPFIRKFIPLLTISNYLMLLTDSTGVVLFIIGDRNEVNSVKNENYGIGTSSCREEITGTTATSLSILHKRPVQLVGPSNYLMERVNNIASSAPIVNSNNDVIGTLGIIQSFGAWSQPDSTRAHSLGWVSSMAKAIASQLELKQKNEQLETAYQTLEATLSVIEEGFITLDDHGMISNINKEACRIFGINQGDDFRHHYTKYFGYDPNIENVIRTSSPVHDVEVSMSNDFMEKRYIMSIEPISNYEKTRFNGAVIRLTRSSRIDRLVGHRGGTKASYTFTDIKGNSEPLLRSLNMAKQIAKTNANILLMGESGTGKELFAQAIHNSFCPDGPFIAVNCASMPRTLIESELFGYEGGTFTGAEKKGRPGKFELANGGTIFLDEIGDMPIEIQPVLLRVLEEKQVMRLGGSKYIPVNVRIIAATNKNLYNMIQTSQFREDLYFRLAVFKVTIPPLRERNADVLVLANYFVETTCQKIGMTPPVLSKETLHVLIDYTWPGNARQLENAMVFAVHMCNGETITPKDLPDEITARDDNPLVTRKALASLAELEKDAIEMTMNSTNNDTSKAAKILGIGRTTLYRKLKEYEIDIP